MKNLILLALFSLSASFAYAGSCCGGCSGDKKDDKSGKAEFQSVSAVAGSGCSGGACGGGKDKDTEKTGLTTPQANMLAGSGCGAGGCGGDKDAGKAEKLASHAFRLA